MRIDEGKRDVYWLWFSVFAEGLSINISQQWGIHMNATAGNLKKKRTTTWFGKKKITIRNANEELMSQVHKYTTMVMAWIYLLRICLDRLSRFQKKKKILLWKRNLLKKKILTAMKMRQNVQLSAKLCITLSIVFKWVQRNTILFDKAFPPHKTGCKCSCRFKQLFLLIANI